MRQFMVIERIREGCLDRVYERFHLKGRMLPPGLHYLDSWLEKDGDRCFQLMETADPGLFPGWTRQWDDLMNLEIIEIRPKPTVE